MRLRHLRDPSYYVPPYFVFTFDAALGNNTVPLRNAGTNYSVDWGDSTTSTAITTTNPVHNYPSAAVYTITITAGLANIQANAVAPIRVRDITSFGATFKANAISIFQGMTTGSFLATDMPSASTDLSYMFSANTIAPPANLDSWDVSAVTTMLATFYNSSYNPPLTNWVTTSLTNMASTFQLNKTFNQPLNHFNTSLVTTFDKTFDMETVSPRGAFNQSLSDWETGNATTMNRMFYASAFNQSVATVGAKWDVSKVTTVSSMFRLSLFNQPLSSWNLALCSNFTNFMTSNAVFNSSVTDLVKSAATNLTSAFQLCTAFNQPLTGWAIQNVTTLSSTFDGCTNFNQDVSALTPTLCQNYQQTFFNCPAFNQPVFNITSAATSLLATFYGCTNFNQAVSGWNTTNVTTLYQTFYNCTNFNQSLATWDTAKVTNMQETFYNCTNFNQALTTSGALWDVSKVTNATRMFRLSGFNQDLSSWNLTAVGLIATGMFTQAASFNNDVTNLIRSNCTRIDDILSYTSFNHASISSWNVSGVTGAYFHSVFRSNTAFNQDLSSWTPGATGSPTLFASCFYGCTAYNSGVFPVPASANNLQTMFYGCTNFNQPLTGWNTSGVLYLIQTFALCTNFNQDISGLDTSACIDFTNMLQSCTNFNNGGVATLGNLDISAVVTTNKLGINPPALSTAVYDQLLTGWEAQVSALGTFTVQTLNFGTAQYTAASAAATSRGILTSAPFNWVITDGGPI